MRKKGLLSAIILLFLSAGLLAPASSSFPAKELGQDLPQRPKFYARGIVCEKNVQNAKDSLGAPDGRYAEILPGGQLVMLMESTLYPFPGPYVPGEERGLPDSGSVVGKGETDFGLEGWFPMQDTQGKPGYVWIPLGLTLSGFCLFPPPTYSFEEDAGVDVIRITNPGTKSLFVDAVIGYGQEAERK